MTGAKPGRIHWFLTFWLFILSAVAFLDRVNISVAGASIASAYHLTNVQLGTVFSALLWGYALFQTLGGRLADRFGPRRVLTMGVIWWGVFTALTAAVPGNIERPLILFVAVRFLLGAGEAVVYPASNQFVSRWIPSQERGIANGWIFAGVGAGAGLSPPLITFLMLHYGWRASFFVCALLGLFVGAAWFLFARDSPAEHPRVSGEELAFIRSGLTTVEHNRKLVPWMRVFTSKDVLGVTVSYFCFGYVAWIFFSWFYIYLAQVRGLNLKASALYAMLPFLAMAAGCTIGGLMSDRITRFRGPRLGRCIFASVVILCAAAFIVLGAKAENAQVASIVLAGGAGVLYLAQSSFWS